MAIQPPLDEEDELQLYSPPDPGPRINGDPPLNVMRLEEAKLRGRELINASLLWSLGYAVIVRITMTQLYEGFTAPSILLFIELCVLTTISVRSMNDSRLYGLRESSIVLSLVFAFSALVVMGTRTDLHASYSLLRSPMVTGRDEARLTLALIFLESLIVIVVVLKAIRNSYLDSPYEKPWNGYSYKEKQDSVLIRSSDTFPGCFAMFLPFVVPRPNHVWDVILIVVIAVSISSRYYYVAIVESLDLRAASAKQVAGVAWFHPKCAERHFLFFEIMGAGIIRLLAPLLVIAVIFAFLPVLPAVYCVVMLASATLVYASYWQLPRSAFEEMQTVFLGYNHEQRRAAGMYELSPSFESPEVRKGWLNAAMISMAIAAYHVFQWPLRNATINDILTGLPCFGALVLLVVLLFSLVCAFPYVWSIYIFGSLYTGIIKEYVNSFQNRRY